MLTREFTHGSIIIIIESNSQQNRTHNNFFRLQFRELLVLSVCVSAGRSIGKQVAGRCEANQSL